MKNVRQTLTTPIGRTFIYLTIFIAGTALHELLFRFMNLTVWSDSARVLTLATIGTFLVVGALFASERHIRSRVASAATLFILAFVSLRIGHSAFVPDPYLFVAAFCVAAIGAQPVLHRKLTSVKQTILYSALTITISLAIVASFTFGMTALDRIVLSAERFSN